MVFYNIIACVDSSYGLGKNKSIPWKVKDEMAYFKQLTDDSIVIMGRITYESIGKALPNRINIVISSTLKQEACADIIIVKSIMESLLYIESLNTIRKVFIIGGSNIYAEFIKMKIPYKIYLNQINEFYDCDNHYEYKIHEENNYILHTESIKHQYDKTSDSDVMVSYREYRYHNVDEYKYLELLNKVIKSGTCKPDRTNTGTLSVFGETIKYDVRNNIIPLLTTKRMFFRGIVEELLFFISGKTDSNILKNKGVNIWNGNTSREFLDKCGLTEYREGDMGPLYPFQLRHWGANYINCDTDYSGKGFDQLSNLINEIKINPNSRRLLFSYWNPTDFSKTPIPTCFHGDTRVLTESGYKKIKNVSLNDKVMSHKMIYRKVNNVQIKCYNKLSYIINTALSNITISTTNEHPFLVNNKWVKAEELQETDLLTYNLIKRGNIPVSKIFILLGYYYKLGNNDCLLINNASVYVLLRGILKLTKIDMKLLVNTKYSLFNCDEFKKIRNRYIDVFGSYNKLKTDILYIGSRNINYFMKGYSLASFGKNNYSYECDHSNSLLLQSMSFYTKKVLIISKLPESKIYQLKITDNNFVKNSAVYIPINSISVIPNKNPIIVYNLECDIDNTYIIENIIVHNCHILYQYYTDPVNNELSCSFYCRSQDYCLGTPFNIASATVLLNIICKLTGYKPGFLIHNMGDVHIYLPFIEKFKKQLEREAYTFPLLHIKNNHSTIDDYVYNDFVLVNYNHHKGIKADMIA